MKKAMMLAVVLTFGVAAALSAHDVWVAQEGGAYVVMWGHDGTSDPYKPAQVTAAKAYNAAGQEVAVTIKPQETKALLALAQKPALMAIVFNAGPWVKTPEGYKNVSKREAKEVLESMKGVTYNKTVWQWHDRFNNPLGGKMELVPLNNPLALKVGDKFSFRLMYGGKPLPGATVMAAGVEKDALKTDANGQAEVVIKKSGLNVVKANLRTPTPNDPDADTLSETANIAFVVK